MVAAILLQRDAGGDLATLLRDLAGSAEAAARQERDAEAATAQARFAARLVVGLPAAAAVLAELASPGLVASLLANPVSLWLTALAVLLQAAALVAVRRLARVTPCP
jgi:tight adherence protein B